MKDSQGKGIKLICMNITIYGTMKNRNSWNREGVLVCNQSLWHSARNEITMGKVGADPKRLIEQCVDNFGNTRSDAARFKVLAEQSKFHHQL